MPSDRRCRKFDADLTAYFQGELPADRREQLESHVEECASCAAQLGEIGSVFRLAGTIEDLAPSMRFKRNLATLLRRSGSPAADEGILLRLRMSGAFLVHRLRTSGRFRLAAVSVGAHVALLLVLSLIVFPGMADKGGPVVVFEPPLVEGMERSGYPDPTDEPLADAHEVQGPPHPLFPDVPTFPDWPETVQHSLPAMLPPARRVVYSSLSGIFAAHIDFDQKRRRMAALVDEPDDALASIDRGLGALAEAQLADGSFPASRRTPDAYRTGVTAATLLAFLSDGNSQTRGRKAWRKVVTRAVDRLVSSQVREGRFAGLLGSPKGHYTYDHALATIALAECFALDQRRLPRKRAEMLRGAISDAVAFIVRAQSPEGGWRYRLYEAGENESDTSVSIFSMLALASARSAGFPVDSTSFKGFGDWLRRVTGDEGVVGYQRRGDRDAEPRTLTAGALFLEESLGLAATLRDRQAGLVREEVKDPKGSLANNGLLRWFSALAFLARGEKILDVIAPHILSTQREDGTWSSADDLHAVHGGDAFATALNVLTLTTAYRFSGA